MIRSFLSFLVSNQLIELSWQMVLWSLIGLGAGAAVGLASYLGIRRWGGYRLEVRGARWWRGLVCGVHLLAFTLAGTYAGLCEGSWRGVHEALTRGALINRVSASLGQVEAIFLAGVYYGALGIRTHPGITPAEEAKVIADGVDAFVSGRAAISAHDLQRELGGIGEEVLTQSLDVVEAKVVALIPYLGEPEPRVVLDKILRGLGKGLARDKAQAGLEYLHLDAYMGHLLVDLPAMAAREGDSGSLTFRQMSEQLGQASLITWVLAAVRSFLRGQQLFALSIAGAVLLVPVLLFALARSFLPDVAPAQVS